MLFSPNVPDNEIKAIWHASDIDEVLQTLKSSRHGLSADEARSRLAEYGHNELKGKKKAPQILVFLRQFLSPLVYILIAAAIIKIVVGGYVDAGVIFFVLILMSTIGFFQETRAEKAMQALMQLAAPLATVRRGGEILEIRSSEIVPGDVILLEAGDKVPADARIIEASNLKINESPLTGESMPIEKHSQTLSADISIAERKNMVHMGTIVANGRTTALVTSTGMKTEIGKIAFAITEVKPETTPLQKSISKLGRTIIYLVLGTSSILVISGVLRGMPVLDVFLLGVAAAVSAIPEGLPAVVTVVLSAGMRLMARSNVIIRKLVAVETLGSASVICSDKTGTLTLNQMTARRLYAGGRWIEITGEGYQPEGHFLDGNKAIVPNEDNSLRLLLHSSLLCNDALLTFERSRYNVLGDPTEGALVVAARKAGFNKEQQEIAYPRLDELPFQSEKQYMATLHSKDNGRIVYAKGSPERILSLSNHLLRDGQVEELGESDIADIMQANNSMAQNAMRVIAVAYMDYPVEKGALLEENIRGNLVFIGLIGMTDPPREEAKQAIKQCNQAGIKVVMITGDNRLTAESIAQQLGLPPGNAVTGNELEKLSDEELENQVESISVFARIEPLHKLRIVSAFKKKGHVVAMTGDGVNDGPALKAANIGIAMGISGTDVAKEASDMVLTDDNFRSIVIAVEEGRAIFNRLRNVVLFMLSTGLGELMALILCVLFLGKAPLLALQILWVNLVTGTIMSIPIGLEPKTGDEMNHPPRNPKVNLMFRGLTYRVGFLSILLSIGIFLVFWWTLEVSTLAEARTVALCSMVVFEWLVAFNARSDEHTFFQLGIFRNRWMIYGLILAILLQLVIVYLPFMQTLFKTVPIGADKWAIAILPGLAVFVIETIRKRFYPRLFNAGK